MEFHPKDLPISKTYDLKNEEDAVKAIEDMVQLGFKEKKEGYKVLMPKETKIAKSANNAALKVETTITNLLSYISDIFPTGN